MSSNHATQYTIRGIPANIDRILRDKAKRQHKSLNQIALEALIKEAGGIGEPKDNHDLDAFFGSWVNDSDVDDALVAQRQIDEGLWK
jgi:hypothetical protein